MLSIELSKIVQRCTPYVNKEIASTADQKYIDAICDIKRCGYIDEDLPKVYAAAQDPIDLHDCSKVGALFDGKAICNHCIFCGDSDDDCSMYDFTESLSTDIPFKDRVEMTKEFVTDCKTYCKIIREHN